MRKQMLTKTNMNLLGVSTSGHFNPVCPDFTYDYAIAGLEHKYFGNYEKEITQRYRCIT